jgi:hypothetical protein
MAVTHELAIGELVELTEPVEGAPAGATGGVTDVLGPDRVIVELTSLPAEPILDRIVFVAPDKLRVIAPARRT